MTTFLSSLEWRSATKKFDPTGTLSDDELAAVMDSIRMAPTSYGLQTFKVLRIVDTDLRKALQPHSWGQSQIVDAAELLVFCHKVQTTAQDVSDYLDKRAIAMGLPRADMNNAQAFMTQKVEEIPAEVHPHWSAKQAYIALGFAMAACAELRIDSCPIEGFSPAEYDTLLGLEKTDYRASVVLAIGRAAADAPVFPKVRKSAEELFETV